MHQVAAIPSGPRARLGAGLAREIPEIVDCHRITGEDCFFVKLHLRSMDDLEEILDRFLVLGQTTTSIIHSSPVAGRPLPLESDAVVARLSAV